MLAFSADKPKCPRCGTPVEPSPAFAPERLLEPLACTGCGEPFGAFWQAGQYWLAVTEGEKEMWAFYALPREERERLVREGLDGAE